MIKLSRSKILRPLVPVGQETKTLEANFFLDFFSITHRCRLFLPHSARVRRLPQYEVSPHFPEHCQFRLLPKHFQVIIANCM